MKTSIIYALALTAASLLVGCGGTAPDSGNAREALGQESQAALTRFKGEAPGLNDFLGTAYGYAVFPNVGKGAFIVGGAYGKGTVYEQNQLIGYADLKQGTAGFQAGGETFAELILFKDKAALDRFTNNQFTFAANASAVAVKTGVAVSARYSDGVAVFTRTKGGLMFEAALGGQEFTFTSARRAEGMSAPAGGNGSGTTVGTGSGPTTAPSAP